jgi:hypothetical protein
MTAKTRKPQQKKRPEWMDDEQWALYRSPEFRKLMDERRAGPFISEEESFRRAGITEEEWAAANAELDRQLAEEAEQEAAEKRRNGAVARE